MRLRGFRCRATASQAAQLCRKKKFEQVELAGTFDRLEAFKLPQQSPQASSFLLLISVSEYI